MEILTKRDSMNSRFKVERARASYRERERERPEKNTNNTHSEWLSVVIWTISFQFSNQNEKIPTEQTLFFLFVTVPSAESETEYNSGKFP